MCRSDVSGSEKSRLDKIRKGIKRVNSNFSYRTRSFGINVFKPIEILKRAFCRRMNLYFPG